MPTPLRLGLAGLGTVGAGVVTQLQRNSGLIAARAGRPVEIVALNARSRSRDRGVDISSYAWEDDPLALARRADVDVVVELIGGEDGVARALVETALLSGKDVVTANKAMLARHAHKLARLAEENGRSLRFEAAVAGGIPVVKTLAEGLAGNAIRRVMGVMNGTCNYIFTRMEAGLAFEAAVDEARAHGFLEADPRLDLDGIDAGQKLALLAALAFGTNVDFEGVTLEGISRVTREDIRLARDMGFAIKLLGVAQMTGRGLEQRMAPSLVPLTHPLGQLQGSTNMILIEGDAVGQVVMSGAGAGAGPTASAVLADVIDLARGIRLFPFGQPAATLKPAPRAAVQAPQPWYLRMTLLDKPGALAKIATVLAAAGISIDRMRQYSHTGPHAPVLMVTHRAGATDIAHALADFSKTGVVVGDPVALRIEEV